MPRSMTTAASAAIIGPRVPVAFFVSINFISEVVRVWSGMNDISWGGFTWLGVGYLGGISTIEEASTINAKGVTVSLSGIPNDILSEVLTDYRVGLPAMIYLGLFDNTGALIADPITAWSGRTDQPTIDVDGTTSTISLALENRLVEMNVAVDRRYTNEDQQLDYPGDRGFEFVNSIQDTRIYWGQVPSSKNNL